MAVPEQIPYLEYAANGVVTSFAVTFQCNSKNKLKVFINGIEQPAVDWQFSGGNVVFNIPPIDGSVVSIERVTPLKRDTTYSSYDNSFRAETVNNDFDVLWHSAQELERKNKNTYQKFQDLLDGLAAGEVAGLSAEILARIAADEQLQENIDIEELRAYAAEQNINLAMDVEKVRVNSELANRYTKSETYNRTEVDTTFSAYVGGRKAFTTLALAQSATGSLSANTAIEVTNDPTSTNNGTYQWNGTTLTKSAYDPLTQAKAYVADFKDDAGIHAKTRLELIKNGVTDSERINSLLSLGGNVGFKSGDLLFAGKTYASLANLTGLSFTRNSNALALDTNNVYQNFTSNNARQIIGKGLFLEVAATQLLTNPVNLSLWTKTSATTTAVANAAPDNSNNAYDIIEATTTASGAAFIASDVALPAGTYCFSAHLSRGSNRYAHMFVYVSGATYGIAIDFDSIGGAIVQVASGALSPVSYGIEKIKDGIYRVFIAVTRTSDASFSFSIRGAGGMTYASRVYNTTSGNVAVRASFAQVEAGLKPSSPILIGSATRPAEDCRLLWAGTNLDDEIVISYGSNSTVTLKRSELASSSEINLMSDAGAPWIGNFIKSVYLFPAKDAAFYANYKDVDSRSSALAIQDKTLLSAINTLLAKSGLGSIGLDFSSALNDLSLTENGCTPYLNIDRANKKYYWHGQFYQSEQALLAESGGVAINNLLSWSAKSISDLDLLAAKFASGTDGFTNTSGGSVAAVNGELEFTATSTTGWFSRSMRGFGGRALKLSAKYRKGTSSGVKLSADTYNTGMTFSPLVTASSDAIMSLYFTPAVGRQFWIGGGLNFGSLGTSYFDDFKLQEVFPLAGFPQARYTVVIDAASPSSLPSTGEQVLWQIDCGTSNDRVYVSIDSTGTIKLTSRFWGTTGGIDYSQKSIITLGTVAANTAFKLAFSVTNSQISAALNGSGSSVDTVGAIGAAYLRIGSSTTVGEEFVGSINSVAMYLGAESLKWLKDKTAIPTIIPAYAKSQKRILMIGDSWSEDSSTGIGPMLRDLGYEVYSVGVGGSTMIQQRDYALAEPDLLKTCTLIWWDGVPNGHTDGQIENEKSYLQSVLTAAGHNRFLWCRNGQAQVTTQQATDMKNFMMWIKQKYGKSHIYDPSSVYASLAIQDPDNAGYTSDQERLALEYVPHSLMMPDFAHLLQSVRRVVVRDMQSSIDVVTKI